MNRQPSFMDRVIDGPLDPLVEGLVAKGVPHNKAFLRVISLRHKGMVRRWRQEDRRRAANPPTPIPMTPVAEGLRVGAPGEHGVLRIEAQSPTYGRNWYRVRLVDGAWPSKAAIVKACDRYSGAPFGGVVELTGKPDEVRVAVYTD